MMKRTYTLCGVICVVMVIGLAALGRIWWCAAGDWSPWSWDVWSSHNSQHWVDPYALSHLQHGIGLFALLSVCGRRYLSVSAIILIVATVEATWELVENSPWMIERYRTATISLDYFGDSICNSLGDFAACMAGLAMARRLPLWAAGGIFLGLELASLAWIRDSLSINILMLIYPLEAVRAWQMQAV